MKTGKVFLFRIIVSLFITTFAAAPFIYADTEQESETATPTMPVSGIEKPANVGMVKTNGLVKVYKIIERSVVIGYYAIENSFVSGYQSIENVFVNKYSIPKPDLSKYGVKHRTPIGNNTNSENPSSVNPNSDYPDRNPTHSGFDGIPKSKVQTK